MVLKKIELKNFRLHQETNLEFSDKLNFIIGGNGQGKTSILEAIYYLCTTKNFNAGLDAEAVNFGKFFFEVTGLFKDTIENTAKIFFNLETNKKNFLIDGKQIYRATAVIGKFPVVTLTQSDHSITLGAPAERRKFVDSIISQSSETYLKILLDYNKTLRQRTSLLTQIKETNSKKLIEQLDAWTETLIDNGAEIIKHRMIFVDQFNDYLKKAYENIMENNEIPFITYKFCNDIDSTDIKKNLEKKINMLRSQEIKRGTNLVGPHRDDLVFLINEKELKKYGSQGQHKTFQIALRFGQFFYLKDTKGKAPIFLLDDVFGELDSFRAFKTSEFLTEVGQAFITLTDFSKYEKLSASENDYFIKIKNGVAAYA